MKRTIEELVKLEDGTSLERVDAVITEVYEQTSGETNGVAWTMQECGLKDETAEIHCRMSYQPKLDETHIGKTLMVRSTVKNGKYLGLKVADSDGQKMLMVTKSARMEFPVPEQEELPKQPASEPAPDAQANEASAPEATAPELPKDTPDSGKIIPKEVYYERTFNTGNYTSQKIGILLELNGAKATEALAKAKYFAEKNGPKEVLNA